MKEIKEEMRKSFALASPEEAEQEIAAVQNTTPDYQGFYEHIKDCEEYSIPMSFGDLIRVAKIYNCEIPKIVNGELVFTTI